MECLSMYNRFIETVTSRQTKDKNMTRKYGSLMRAADAEFLRPASKHEYKLSNDRYEKNVNSGGAILACKNGCVHSGGPSKSELHDYGCDAEWITCWVDP